MTLGGLLALFIVLAIVGAPAPARSAEEVSPGSANAICSYDHISWQLHWSGAAAGWSRGNLNWTLKVYGAGFELSNLRHSGTFFNSTGGTTASYSAGLTPVVYEVTMTVTGPGGTVTGDCWAT